MPKELCADMYVQAVVDFIKEGWNKPKELHIIDIDTSILRLVEVSCKKWRKDPGSTKPAEALKQYLKEHPYAGGYTGQGQGYVRGKRAQRQFSEPASEAVGMSDVADALKGLSVKKAGTESLKWGGKDTIYNVNGSLKVHIYTGKIDRVEFVDAVVCSIDTGFGTNGYIVKAFRDAFGEKYKYNFDKMKDRERSLGTNNFVYTCETGSVYARNVMHLAMTPLLRGSKDELREYKTGISNLLNKAERKGFSKIAVPLLGTGMYMLSIWYKQQLLLIIPKFKTSSSLQKLSSLICVLLGWKLWRHILSWHPKVSDMYLQIVQIRLALRAV